MDKKFKSHLVYTYFIIQLGTTYTIRMESLLSTCLIFIGGKMNTLEPGFYVDLYSAAPSTA